jgi:hypothetical protein
VLALFLPLLALALVVLFCVVAVRLARRFFRRSPTTQEKRAPAE